MQGKWTISPERAKKAHLGRKLKRLNRLRRPKRIDFLGNSSLRGRKRRFLSFIALARRGRNRFHPMQIVGDMSLFARKFAHSEKQRLRISFSAEFVHLRCHFIQDRPHLLRAPRKGRWRRRPLPHPSPTRRHRPKQSHAHHSRKPIGSTNGHHARSPDQLGSQRAAKPRLRPTRSSPTSRWLRSEEHTS